MNTPDVQCSACGDTISITIARVTEDSEFAMCAEEMTYHCPVCAIQAKNSAMQRQLLQAAHTGA